MSKSRPFVYESEVVTTKQVYFVHIRQNICLPMNTNQVQPSQVVAECTNERQSVFEIYLVLFQVLTLWLIFIAVIEYFKLRTNAKNLLNIERKLYFSKIYKSGYSSVWNISFVILFQVVLLFQIENWIVIKLITAILCPPLHSNINLFQASSVHLAMATGHVILHMNIYFPQACR